MANHLIKPEFSAQNSLKYGVQRAGLVTTWGEAWEVVCPDKAWKQAPPPSPPEPSSLALCILSIGLLLS